MLQLFILLISISVSECVLSQAEKDTFVSLHNQYRSSVVPSAANMLRMVWNTGIEAKAQAYANSIADWDSSGHSSEQYRTYNDGVFNGYHGENLAIGQQDVAEVMSDWIVSERVNPRNDQSQSNGGHMTQAIWANSWLLGCAERDNVAFSGTTGKYWICQYGPGGNYVGENDYVSGPSCSKCPTGTTCSGTLCNGPGAAPVPEPAPGPSSEPVPEPEPEGENSTNWQTGYWATITGPEPEPEWEPVGEPEGEYGKATNKGVTLAPNNNNAASGNSNASAGVIAGSVVGAIVLLAIVGVVIFVVIFMRRRKAASNTKSDVELTQGGNRPNRGGTNPFAQ